jgi:hypothetical protein
LSHMCSIQFGSEVLRIVVGPCVKGHFIHAGSSDPEFFFFFLEVRCKRPQKREDHLIFMNFIVKKFIVKNTQKKNFDV